MHYDKVEEFVIMVTNAVPDLLSFKHTAQLILGLRARMTLELFRKDHTPTPQAVFQLLEKMKICTPLQQKDVEVEESQANFTLLVQTLLKNPDERKHFFQEVFPVQYGSKFDCALQALVGGLVLRLEQLLPMPDISQIGAMIICEPAIFEACRHSVLDPEPFITLLDHQKCMGLLTKYAISSNVGDCVLSSLSIRPTTVEPAEQPGEPSASFEPCEEAPKVMSPCSISDSEDQGAMSDDLANRNEVDLRENEVSRTNVSTSPVDVSAGNGSFQNKPQFKRVFSSNGCLKVHMRTHSSERPHTCSICHKGFTQIGNLRIHEKLHSNERPYRCDLCDKTYKISTHLNAHKITHSDVKPWTCTTCGKGFRYPGVLKKHEKIHSGEQTENASRPGPNTKRNKPSTSKMHDGNC
ncbi:uncharacterized protein FYW47_013642 [Aplochiton taeniatus]